jgi:hypothetical protein
MHLLLENVTLDRFVTRWDVETPNAWLYCAQNQSPLRGGFPTYGYKVVKKIASR